MNPPNSTVPEARIRTVNDRRVWPEADYVVYWMTTARRLQWNFGLQRAVDWAVASKKPLVILEALRCDYPHANDRVHQFILDGMACNQRRAAGAHVLYYPYVEPTRGHGSGLITTLGSRACIVVTDWYPAFFLPRMIAAAGRKLAVRLEAVDSNGLIPLAVHEKAFPAARFYRAFMQRALRDHITAVPEAAPLDRLGSKPRLATLTGNVTRRWPADTLKGGEMAGVAAHRSPGPSLDPTRGGSERATGSAAGLRLAPAVDVRRRTTIIRMRRPRAGCRRICISATSRRMKSFRQ